MAKNKFFSAFVLLTVGIFLRYFLAKFLTNRLPIFGQIIVIILIISIGAFYIIQETAKIIEETTEILSEKTKIAGGVLQSIGTAFPDMVLGIVAALTSLQMRGSNYPESINYAIIAAATTFGSNIYNIGYGIWCIFRQNLANKLNISIRLNPLFQRMGMVSPMNLHKIVPDLKEIDTSIDVLNALTVLTAITVFSMVIFGKVGPSDNPLSGDLYQLIKPVGALIFVFAISIIYFFRKTTRVANFEEDVINPNKYFRNKPETIIWISLVLAGIAILFTAQAMIFAVKTLSDISRIPVVVTGVMAGIIGCLGEMAVIHNFTVNPNGRIGDAVVGIGMDNIVTIAGASIVAMLGGVYLGGNALILIFVMTLSLNTILIWQISKLKNFVLNKK